MDEAFDGLPYDDLDEVPTDAIRDAKFRERIQQSLWSTSMMLNDQIVRAAVCRSQESWVHDLGYRGLALRLRKTGGKTYYYLWSYQKDEGSHREFVGSASKYTVDQARKKAKLIANHLYYPERPRKLCSSMPVKEVLDEYFVEHRSDWFKTVQSLFNHYIVPRYGNQFLSGFGYDGLCTVIEIAALDQRSRGAHLHKALRAFLYWAVKRGLLGSNPLSRTKFDFPVLPDASGRDENSLTIDELCAIYRAALGLGEPWLTMVGLLILTGEAVEHVRQIQNSNIDWDQSLWTLKRRIAPRWPVPLSKEAIELLMPYRKQQGYFFRSPRSDLPINFYAEIIKQLRSKTRVVHWKWGVRDVRFAVRREIDSLSDGPDAVSLWAKHFMSVLNNENEEAVTL